MKQYRPNKLCVQCKGDCCKRLPGIAYPKELGLPRITELKKRLTSGEWTIDWWEGDPRDGASELDCSYYIRPAVKGEEGKLTDPSYGGGCTFLAEKGCELSFNKRPLGCRMLEPKPNRECDSHGYNKQHAALAYLPYQKEIETIIDSQEREGE